MSIPATILILILILAVVIFLLESRKKANGDIKDDDFLDRLSVCVSDFDSDD